MAAPPTLVFDHNFPPLVIAGLRFPGLILRSLQDIYPDLIDSHEDWEEMRELRARREVEGWITLDKRMLNQDKEMVVLHQPRLSMVVFDGVDNDPLVATGLLLIHANQIAKQLHPRRPQLWIIRRPPAKAPTNPWERISDIARRRGMTPDDLYNLHKLSRRELR